MAALNDQLIQLGILLDLEQISREDFDVRKARFLELAQSTVHGAAGQAAAPLLLDMATFRVHRDQEVLAEFQFSEGPVVLGSTPSAHITVDDPSVRGRHAVFKRQAGFWLVEAVDRHSPIVVSGRETTAHPLRSGDRVEVGNLDVEFSQGDAWAEAMEGSEAEEAIETNETSSSTLALSAAQLVGVYNRNRDLLEAHLAWVDGAGKDQVFALDQAITQLGSLPGSDVRVPEPQSASILGPGASPGRTDGLWARVVCKSGQFFLEPLRPHISVNDIPFATTLVLQDSDCIALGTMQIVFRAAL